MPWTRALNGLKLLRKVECAEIFLHRHCYVVGDVAAETPIVRRVVLFAVCREEVLSFPGEHVAAGVIAAGVEEFLLQGLEGAAQPGVGAHVRRRLVQKDLYHPLKLERK